MPSLPSNLALTSIADGTTIIAVDHRNNYTAIQTAVNSLITALDDGVAGQVLTGVGTTLSFAYMGGVYRKTTEKDVVSTVTATDLLNGEVTVGASVLGTDRTLRATLIGDYLNNSGANRTLTVDVALGGTTLMKDTIGTTNSISAGATRRPFKIVVDVANLGAANSQYGVMRMELGSNAAATTGIGEFLYMVENDVTVTPNDFTPGGVLGVSATTAVDTSLASAFTVKVTHSASSGSLSCRLKYAIVEVI